MLMLERCRQGAWQAVGRRVLEEGRQNDGRKLPESSRLETDRRAGTRNDHDSGMLAWGCAG